MPDIDFFDFFRYLLGTIVTIYVTIVTLQSLWGWYVFLAGSDKYVGLVRRYVIVHGLRLRFKTFWGDVIISILLCVVFCLMWRAHTLLREMHATHIAIAQQEREIRQREIKILETPHQNPASQATTTLRNHVGSIQPS